jgi:hypothetical protein
MASIAPLYIFLIPALDEHQATKISARGISGSNEGSEKTLGDQTPKAAATPPAAKSPQVASVATVGSVYNILHHR